ncbi:MAG: hypothetical protein QMC89_00755 [Candidatus Hodarchaeaceae archaeon]|nr:hypothetical protein [Candidatus Hodarchaeaceae archaeon]
MGRLRHIAIELRDHAPFTAFGASSGAAIAGAMYLPRAETMIDLSWKAFHIFHPLHLLLSAIVTAAMFRRHGGGILSAVSIGAAGSVGICMMSDVVIPYLGGSLLGVEMTLHIDLLEHPQFVVVPILAGAAIGAATRLWTRCPHAAHVMISTLASLFYLTAFGVADWIPKLPFVFVLLFVAVWLPCCTSDIVFPLSFAKRF